LNRGESVHQLQRAIYGGAVAQERGRRRQEIVAISGAHALLTNIVLAWNTNRIDAVAARLKGDGIRIEEDWLRRIGPAHFLDGVKQHGRSNDNHPGRRIDSSELLPELTCCLT
jgi:Tn3 transposase DDE domain